MTREKTSHPSYGQVHFSRVQSSTGQVMYGSKIRHTQYITMTVSTSHSVRSLNEDNYFADKDIIQVRMSENQFAHLITTLNRGCGTPCTIERLNGENVEGPAHLVTETQKFRKEFRQKVAGLAASMNEAVARLQALSQPGAKVNKAAVNDLLENITKIQQEIACNMPFVVGQFEEAMEQIVSSAKHDIDAYATNKMMALGGYEKPIVLLEGPEGSSDA